MADADVEAAWDALHAVTPPGWYVGRPSQRHGGSWAIYAFDTTEKAQIGKRSREWTAVGQTEVEWPAGDGAMPAPDQPGTRSEMSYRQPPERSQQ